MTKRKRNGHETNWKYVAMDKGNVHIRIRIHIAIHNVSILHMMIHSNQRIYLVFSEG